jgi:superfamily II DNA/RNA helicase
VFKGVKIVRIDGKTPARERQARIKAFQEDGTVRAALLGITAAGVAITLTAASRAVFAELFWTPAALLQAEDRCHRIGQTAEVQIDYIVAQNSVDDILWPLIQEKMKVIGEMVEGKKGASLAFTTPNGDDPDEEGAEDELVEELAREDRDAGSGGDDDGDDDGEERREVDPATAAMDRQRLAAMREAEAEERHQARAAHGGDSRGYSNGAGPSSSSSSSSSSTRRRLAWSSSRWTGSGRASGCTQCPTPPRRCSPAQLRRLRRRWRRYSSSRWPSSRR